MSHCLAGRSAPEKRNRHVWVCKICKDGFIPKSVESAFNTDEKHSPESSEHKLHELYTPHSQGRQQINIFIAVRGSASESLIFLMAAVSGRGNLPQLREGTAPHSAVESSNNTNMTLEE
ncbi:hypothetical protein AOLI_G00292600 [Acnodon oligacanthus]